MRDNVTISCRGASFEVGRGRGFYGIWAIGAPDDKPFAWWPETDDGWSAAWQRFTQIEVPGTIAPAGQSTVARPVRDLRSIAAIPLLAIGVALGLIGLFPGYIGSPSLASQPSQLVAHLIYLAGWAGCAVLILFGGPRQRFGALGGIGVSAITLGLFASDLATAGTATSSGLIGAGLILTVIGWAVCTAGAILAFRLPGRDSRQARLPLLGGQGTPLIALAAMVIAGVGAAIAFAPSWDRFTVESSSGPLQTVTEGNAFANPGLVIAADVAVMIAIVAIVVLTAFWRRASLGPALLAGAIVPLVAQAVSALIQLGQAVSPDQFGYSPVQIQLLGLTVRSGLTVAFWVFCGFVLALILSALQLGTAPDAAVPAPPVATPVSPRASSAGAAGLADTGLAGAEPVNAGPADAAPANSESALGADPFGPDSLRADV